MSAISTPERGIARATVDALSPDPDLDEVGVPTCAEDAAEAILRRPRARSPYARTVNPLLATLRLSPNRNLDVATYSGLMILGLFALVALLGSLLM